MPKVALVQVIYNTRQFIPIVFPAALKQTYPDTEFIVVIAGNDDKSKEYIQEYFPQVKIVDPGYNIGFSKGHNELFASLKDVDFFQLINPDLVITENFVEEMIKPFLNDPQVGAVSGKILRYDFLNNKKTNQIDTTGIIMSKSGRGRDRGQYEIENGQYDSQTDIIGVSGAAAMYRRAALEDVKFTYNNHTQYYDEEFHSYWEDVDLSWRIVNRGWKIKYNPLAVAYHGRAAAASPGGYKKVWSFIQHHKKISSQILQWNYKNHIFLFIKNSPKWYWQFFVREFFYNIFVLVFETKTYKVLPTMFKQFPIIWKKRKYIQATRKISIEDMEKLLQ